MNVLAIGCHPDDLEVGCGGTLRKYVDQGADVYMCHIANGNLGHVIIEPEPLARIRNLEARKSGAILGAKQVFDLGVGDTRVDSGDEDIVDAVADVVRLAKPDLIITHNDKDYMLDHTETSRLAIKGSFCSGLSHRKGEHETFHSFVPIFFMDTISGVDFQPVYYVDITSQIETKLKALSCHESQIKWMLDHDHIDFVEMIRVCSKYRGYQCGVPYAEGFRPFSSYARYSAKRLLPQEPI